MSTAALRSYTDEQYYPEIFTKPWIRKKDENVLYPSVSSWQQPTNNGAYIGQTNYRANMASAIAANTNQKPSLWNSFTKAAYNVGRNFVHTAFSAETYSKKNVAKAFTTMAVGGVFRSMIVGALATSALSPLTTIALAGAGTVVAATLTMGTIEVSKSLWNTKYQKGSGISGHFKNVAANTNITRESLRNKALFSLAFGSLGAAIAPFVGDMLVGEAQARGMSDHEYSDVDEHPGEDTVDESPVDEHPGEDTVDETPVDDHPDETPVDETPVDTPVVEDRGGDDDHYEPHEPWCADGTIVSTGQWFWQRACITETPQVITSVSEPAVVHQPAPPPPPICDGIPDDATAYQFEIVERVEETSAAEETVEATEEAPAAEETVEATEEAPAAEEVDEAPVVEDAAEEVDEAPVVEDAAEEVDDAPAAEDAAPEQSPIVINLNDADPHGVVSGDNMWDIVEERYAHILDCDSEDYDKQVQRITDMIAFINEYENAEAHIIHPGDQLNMLTPEIAEMIINMDEYVFSQCWEGLDYRTIQGGGFIIATEPCDPVVTADGDNVVPIRPQPRPEAAQPALEAA